MPEQFGSFEGLDNRRDVFRMLERLGHGVSEEVGAARRAAFLSSLMQASTTLAGKPLLVAPCGVGEAYHEFVAITGCLGVPIEEAAKRLEEVARHS